MATLELPALAGASVLDQPRRSSRLLQLDALRGIAALMVVFAHAIEFRIGGARPGGFLIWRAFNWGNVGVAAFFCISGFVIPYSFGSGERRTAARAFVISRLARLYPAYWCSIVAAVLYSYLGKHPSPATLILANLTMMQRFFGQPDLLGVYWTLLIELLFYACCLGAFLAGVLRSVRFLFMAALVCLAAGACCNVAALPALPFISLSLMYLSCLFRMALIEHKTHAGSLSLAGLTIWLVTFGLSGVTEGARTIESWSLGVAVFIAASLFRGSVPAVLTWLGTVSYGIYLYHELVSGMVKHFLPGALNLPYPGFVLTTLGSIGVASVSYLLLEHPAIRYGKVLAKRQPDGVYGVSREQK